jgi:hypothetical protein
VESSYINEQIQKDLDRKAFKQKLESVRANKNKLQDQYMSQHFSELKKYSVWE